MEKTAELISYGAISTDFKVIANFSRILTKLKELKQTRLDCYQCPNPIVNEAIAKKFEAKNLEESTIIEVFAPSKNYPMHVDYGGISYFIPLEEGIFQIGGVNYPIVPFVLYAFEDSMLHNSNFASIMLK